MDEVKFDDQKYQLPARHAQPSGRGLIAWLIAKKWAPNAEEAARFLLILTVVAIVAAIVIWWFVSPKQVEVPPGFEENFKGMLKAK